MKTILLFIVGLFLLTGCKNHGSTSDSPSSPSSKKAKKHSAGKRSTKSSSSSVTVTKKTSFSDLEEEILFHVNKYRRSIGLSTLQMNPVITTEAEKHSSNMASKRSGINHAGFSSRVKRISNQLGSVSQSGENVAFGFTSAKDVVNGWLHSPGHKKNIEGSFRLTGIGVAKDRTGTLFFTQLFVTR
jgi:uncharacterized protein YkwD